MRTNFNGNVIAMIIGSWRVEPQSASAPLLQKQVRDINMVQHFYFIEQKSFQIKKYFTYEVLETAYETFIIC